MYCIAQGSQGKYFCKNTNDSVSAELAFATVDTNINIYVWVTSLMVHKAGTFTKAPETATVMYLPWLPCSTLKRFNYLCLYRTDQGNQGKY